MQRWIEALDDLAVVCSACDGYRMPECWSRLESLLEAAPFNLDEIGILRAAGQQRVAWIEQAAWESVVLSVLGSDVSYMVSRGQGGACLASIVLCGGEIEVTSEGSTVALAVLAAVLMSLIEVSRDRLPG